MSRKAISTGARVTLNIVADWPIDVVSADLAGNTTVSLPGNFAGSNRPTKVTVVYFPGVPTASTSVADVLNGHPSGTVDVPGAGVLGNDVIIPVTVPLPLPLGTVTVLAVGEFIN